jgi:hypothetical protein
MFEKIPIAAKWITAVISTIAMVGGIAWGMALWVNNQNLKANKTDNLEILIKEVIDTLSVHGRKIGSLSGNMVELVKKQDAFTKSYVMYVKTNTKFTNDFMKYMEGLSFEVVPPEPNFEKGNEESNFKIRIQKIK